MVSAVLMVSGIRGFRGLGIHPHRFPQKPGKKPNCENLRKTHPAESLTGNPERPEKTAIPQKPRNENGEIIGA
jgi:hypothetical protein